MSARSMLRSLALVLAVSVVPATALADDAPAGRSEIAQRGDGAGKGHGKGHGPRGEKGDRPSFPMKGGDFITHVESKISKIRARVAEKVAERNLPDPVKKQVMAEVDAGAAKVRAAAQKAAADGTVTKEEAKAVREVAKEVKSDLREKAGMKKDREGRGGRGKGKGKGNKGDA